MFAYVLVVSVLLAGQLRAGEDRYQGDKQAGDSSGAAATGSLGSGSGSGLQPLSDPSADFGSGLKSLGSESTPPAATSGASAPDTTSPFRSSVPANSNPPRNLPPMDTNAAPVGRASQTTPAAFENTGSPYSAAPAPPPGAMKPSQMMRAMLATPTTGSQLTGQPMALVEVVGGARTRAEQTQRVLAYWDLCSSVADYYLGIRERDELRGLQSTAPSGAATWQQADKELVVRLVTSHRAALASQMRLASLIGRGGSLPLPADAPHCASYLTHFERVFSTGAPAEARELNQLLAARYVELQGACLAVTRAEDWLDSVARASGNNAEAEGNQRALELLALRRRAFVQIARDYNYRIARYAELATPGQVSAERLTGMLINTTTSSTARRPAALAPPRNRQSSDGSVPQQTFAESSASGVNTESATTKRDEAVQPASGSEAAANAFSESPTEKSLVVPPKR